MNDVDMVWWFLVQSWDKVGLLVPNLHGDSNCLFHLISKLWKCVFLGSDSVQTSKREALSPWYHAAAALSGLNTINGMQRKKRQRCIQDKCIVLYKMASTKSTSSFFSSDKRSVYIGDAHISILGIIICCSPILLSSFNSGLEKKSSGKKKTPLHNRSNTQQCQRQ